MSWLSSGIRKLRKGPIGRFFDKHLDEMLTIPGIVTGQPWLAAGGRALGGAIGPEREKTVGGFLRKGAEGYGAGQLGKLAGFGGGRAAAAGAGGMPGGAPPVPATGASMPPPPAPGMVNSMPGPGMVRGPMANVTGGGSVSPMVRGINPSTIPSGFGGGGRAAMPAAPQSPGGGFRGFFSDPNKLMLASQGLGLGMQGYGAYQQGKAMDEQTDFERAQYEREMMRRKRMAEMFAPFLQSLGPGAMKPPERSW